MKTNEEEQNTLDKRSFERINEQNWTEQKTKREEKSLTECKEGKKSKDVG